VPYTASGEEIFLGDIIVSQAVCQYDFGRQYPKVIKKDTLEGKFGRPSQEIRSFLARVQTRPYRRRLRNSLTRYLQELQQNLRDVECPGGAADRLYKSTHVHKHGEYLVCDQCRDGTQICEAAWAATCLETGCKDTELARSRMRDGLDSVPPEIHFGLMASSDSVIKSAEYRDSIANENGVIGFDMEGAEIFDYFPSLIIKGVCDYADSHKNKTWQSYSAATAAACLKGSCMNGARKIKILRKVSSLQSEL
jgi:nucleoside phosphorylase